MALTKINIIEKIVAQHEFTKKDSTDIVECFLSIIKQTLEAGEEIKITGFGKFEVKQKKDRKGRNPATGDSMTLRARKVVVFRSSAKLKTAINNLPV